MTFILTPNGRKPLQLNEQNEELDEIFGLGSKEKVDGVTVTVKKNKAHVSKKDFDKISDRYKRNQSGKQQVAVRDPMSGLPTWMHVAIAEDTQIDHVRSIKLGETEMSFIITPTGRKPIHKNAEELELDEESLQEVQDRYQRAHGKKAGGKGRWMFTTKRIGDVDYKNDKEFYQHDKEDTVSAAAAAARKALGTKDVYVMEELEEAKKRMGSDKPVNPKDLVVSLDDWEKQQSKKKPRGYKARDRLLHDLMKEKKLDPVGKEDDDVDNDGDTDASDEYLKNRRKVIAKAMKDKKKVDEQVSDKKRKLKAEFDKEKSSRDDFDPNPQSKDTISEKSMTDVQRKKREEIVKSMKKNKAGFEKRYGEDAKSVMYATATKLAMKNKE